MDTFTEKGLITMSNESLDDNYWSRPRLGFFAGPIVFVLMLLVPPPDTLSQEAWGVAAVGLLMAIWWVSEVYHKWPRQDFY